MLVQRAGLVINVASHAAGSGKSARSRVILPYSVCKAGLHRLSADMAVELRDAGVAVISVWPPASKTEGVIAQPDAFGDISGWKPPLFTGRVVAAFVAVKTLWRGPAMRLSSKTSPTSWVSATRRTPKMKTTRSYVQTLLPGRWDATRGGLPSP
jgi:NAD(P)-dependent dehydrogenase (short-subunit alcohol dehydrogenase family)